MGKHRMIRVCVLAMAACLWLLLSGFNFPEPQGAVNDYANVIEPGARQRLEDELRGYRERVGTQIVVVTVSDLQGGTIEQFSYDLFNTWGIGHARHDNGIMLLYAPNAPQGARVRIEVGRGLERQITDADARRLIATEFRPRAQGGLGDRSAAVTETARAIVRDLGSVRTSPPDHSRASAGWTDGEIAIAVIVVILLILFFVWLMSRSNGGAYRSSSSSFFFFDSGSSSSGGGDSGSSFFGGGGSDGGGGSGGD